MNDLTKQQNHSTSCANFDLETLNFQNLICPFGLKHGVYTAATLKDFRIDEMRTNGGIGGGVGEVALINVTKTAYQYKFQGQERQDELGLNWDSFKWRNYDYAIGRFFNVDPLAEQYAYNSTYAFQENKMGMGRELEGLELVEWAKENQVKIHYIQPGKPTQNSLIERINRSCREELLNPYIFDMLQQVEVKATQWQWEYNHQRPRKSLGYKSPKQFEIMNN